MARLFIDLLKTARPRQWLKNFSLAAALIFSGRLFDSNSFYLTTAATIIFSILTSSVYFMNDVVDIDKDKAHPFKKKRPVASGRIPVLAAGSIAVCGMVISLFLAYGLSAFFFLMCLLYLSLQVVYSLILKNAVVFDVIAIAASFILRVYAGAIVLNYHISIWFLLCVTSISLFMAVGKRKAELNLLNIKYAGNYRKTLTRYTPDLLDGYLSMFAASAWISWAFFTFLESPPIVIGHPTIKTFLPLTLSGTNKWLMATIPVVIYGIMRYMSIVYQGARAESPERVILSDKPLMGAVLVWGAMVVWIIYGVGQ